MRTDGTSGAAVPRPDAADDPPPGELPAVVTNEREPDEPGDALEAAAWLCMYLTPSAAMTIAPTRYPTT